ncbi:peptidylprolyl isomerase [bacterium]|nr:peptidylprolyl isomerase [bacterium]
MTNRFLLLFFFLLLVGEASLAPVHGQDGELFLDAVVASVNGDPITLTEVSKRAGVPTPRSLSEAANNEQIQFTLQQMVTEHLLKAESRERRIGVSNDELNRYVMRVAQQNAMTVDEFEAALKEEGKALESYRTQVEMDILRTKLASAIMREGITVGENEIDSYIEEHPEFQNDGAKIKIRQILLEKKSNEEEVARKKLNELRADISTLEEFQEAASRYSEGPEAAEGGALGVFSEEELSGEIFDALFQLPEDSLSEVIETGRGYHLFFIEKRFVSEEDEEEKTRLREEIRSQIEKQKMDEKLRLYFAQELRNKFSVDKKI